MSKDTPAEEVDKDKNTVWYEIDQYEALKKGGCVHATIHFYEDKNVWLSPSPPDAGKEQDENKKLRGVIEKFCEAVTSYRVMKEDNPKNKNNGLVNAWNKIANVCWDARKLLSSVRNDEGSDTTGDAMKNSPFGK